MPTILLVEDDSTQRAILRDHLSGYELIEADCRAEGLSVLRCGAIIVDLVLWDLGLPDAGDSRDERIGSLGLACAIAGPARVVVLTGDSECAEECLEAGAADFLAKPSTRSQIRARVSVALRAQTEATHRAATRWGIAQAVAEFRGRHGLPAHA